MGGGFNAAQNFYNMGAQQAVPNPQVAQAQKDERNAMGWQCSCGAVNQGKFCAECGAKKPENDSWTCTCGTVNKGKFCSECGSPKPEDDSWKCACGAENTGKFCQNCGAKRP